MSRYLALFGLAGLTACASNTRNREPEVVYVEKPVVVKPVVVKPKVRTADPNINIDRNFLRRAASRGQFEVESARLALDRSGPGETAQFARVMLRDFRSANRRLELLTASKAVELPVRMMADHERKLVQLRALPRDQFDDEYARIQAQEYRDTLALHQRCARYCRDVELRNYAAEMLSMLREHERYVRELTAIARR